MRPSLGCTRSGASSPSPVAVLLIVSAFLPWAYAFSALDGMTLVGNPSPLQRCGAVLGLLVGGLALAAGLVPNRPKRPRAGWVRGAKAAGTGALVFMLLIVAAIALELGAGQRRSTAAGSPWPARLRPSSAPS